MLHSHLLILLVAIHVATVGAARECPDVPEYGCSICGPNKCVTRGNELVELPGDDPPFLGSIFNKFIECSRLEMEFMKGYLPQNQCKLLPDIIGDPCGCEESTNNNTISLPSSCPPEGEKPFPGTTCSDIGLKCQYDPFSCPGSNEEFYLEQYFCNNGSWLRTPMGISCPESDGSPNNSPSCPDISGDAAISGATCTNFGDTCNYNPFSCPGSTEEIYIIECNCIEGFSQQGFLSCSTAGVSCDFGDDDDDDDDDGNDDDDDGGSDLSPSPNNSLSCPPSTKDALPGTPCDYIGELCLYVPFSCPGSTEVLGYTTRCSCEDGGVLNCEGNAIYCDTWDGDADSGSNGGDDDDDDSDDDDDNDDIEVEDGNNTPSETDFLDFTCFSENSKVQVKDKGDVLVRNLSTGDEVLVENNKYEPVYTFAHRNELVFTKYLQFHPSLLELSHDHMVFVEGRGAIPAIMVQTGDIFLKGGIVRSIREIERKGAYSPFTASGTIVVNGVLSSNYISFQQSNVLKIGNIKTPFTYQWLAQTFVTPYRIWSTVSGGKSIENGMWHAIGFRGYKWYVNQSPIVMSILLLPILAMLLLFIGVEFILWNPTVCTATIATSSTILWRIIGKKV